MFYGIADIISKVFITLILLNASASKEGWEAAQCLSELTDATEKELFSNNQLLEKLLPANIRGDFKGDTFTTKEIDECTIISIEISNLDEIFTLLGETGGLKYANELWETVSVIAGNYEVLKYKNIGNCYLGVVGCPHPTFDHSSKGIEFALKVLQTTKEFQTPHNAKIKIAISSGSVTCGLVGNHFKILGDVVLNALEILLVCKPMQIRISESTFKLTPLNPKFIMGGPDIVVIPRKSLLNEVNGSKIGDEGFASILGTRSNQ